MLRKLLVMFKRVIAVGILFHGTGCGFIGLGIGAATDASRARESRLVTVPLAQLDSIQLGSTIALTLMNRSHVAGVYAGAGQEHPAAYAALPPRTGGSSLVILRFRTSQTRSRSKQPPGN